MKKDSKSVSKSAKKASSRPWRINKDVWTDTMFEEKLLTNPSLMTNHELALAVEEHQKWRRGMEKYSWEEDPLKEGKEDESPFSSTVLTKIIYEVIARLNIIGDITSGRFKNNG